jgi:hypothetical protein
MGMITRATTTAATGMRTVTAMGTATTIITTRRPIWAAPSPSG